MGDPVSPEPRPDAPDRVRATGPLGCCSKGAAFLATNRERAAYPRLERPQIKRRGRWRDASWDEALGHVAARLLELRARHGRKAIAFYGVGQAPIESFWIAKKLFQGYLGTNHVGTNAELCLAAQAGGHELVFGNEGSFTCYEDYAAADAILLYGSNQAVNHPTMFRRGFLRNKRAIRFVVDPRVTETVRHALAGPGEAHHVRIRSGGDIQLNLAVAHRLFERSWIDAAYLERHVDAESRAAYEALARAPRFAPNQVARRLAPTAEDAPLLERQIERMAEVWGRRAGESLRVVTTSSVGINQTSGSQGVASILGLHLLTGTLGREGCGHVRLAGQSNASAELAMGFSSLLLPFRLPVTERRNRVRMAHHWGIPPWMLSQHSGSPVTRYASCDEIHFLLTMGCDYLRNMTELDAWRRKLRECFVVTCDPYPNPECREFADVLLPARTHGETGGVYMNGERRLQLVEPHAEPPCEAWDDATILVELALQVADRLLVWEGGGAFARARDNLLQWNWIFRDTRRWPPADPTDRDVDDRARMGNLDLDPHPIRAAFDFPRRAARQVESESVWEEIRQASIGLYNEFSDERGPITYQRMRDEGGVRWGGARRYTPESCGPPEDPGAIFSGRYQHQHRRATLHVPEERFLGPTREPGQYVLNTGRGLIGPGHEAANVAMFNGCVKSGFDHLPEQHVLALHPDDARALGVSDGDAVEITSPAGALVLPVLVTEDVIPGEPYVPFQPDRAGTALNRIVLPGQLDPVVNQPPIKRLMVGLRKASAPRREPRPGLLRRLVESLRLF